VLKLIHGLHIPAWLLRRRVLFSAVLSSLMLAGLPSALAQHPEIIRGSGEFLNTASAQAETGPERLPGGPVTVRYNEADIGAVIDELVGEVLGLDYTVAADVQGRISLRMTDVETRSGVIQRLRSALNAVNVAMIDRGDFIAFVRGGGGQAGSVALIAPGEPVSAGTNIAALTLRDASPSAISPILTALNNGVQVRYTDDARGLLVLSGEPAMLTAASESALLLDLDLMDSVSTGVFSLAHAEPQVVAGELRQILRAPSEVMEFVPIERLGLLVVLSNNASALQRVSGWIERLDRPVTRTVTPGRRVYAVRHTDPVELVESLYSVMGRSGGQRTGGQGANPLDDAQVGAAPDQNIILVRGEEAAVAAVAEMLDMLDQPRPQVLIRAVIAEVTLTDETRFGVDWSGLADDRLDVTLSQNASGAAQARFPGFAVVYTNTDLDIALNALASDTELEVISRPSILTLHNEQAELQVGDQVPVVVQSAVSVTNPDAPIVNQTAYRNTGVLLTVTPQIRAGGLVEIEISQEVSGVLQTTSSGIDSPTITQRRLSSTLLVPSGEAVALGGLISTRRTDSQSGVPVLRSVPILGRAFRSEGTSNDRTELIILLTPTIITDPREAPAELALPAALERLRARIDAE